MPRFAVDTSTREEFVDVTEQVGQALRQCGLTEGALLVYSPHTPLESPSTRARTRT
jgi:thiamine phosphate synthase YjbQ (UPF0047 family)